MKQMILTITMVLVAGFISTNCSDAGFAKDEGTPIVDETKYTPIPPITVEDKCATGTIKVKNFNNIFFDNPVNMNQYSAQNEQGQTETGACPWNSSNNLGIRDEYFQARVEQNYTMDLPANATLCDIDFQFQQQNFWFDDVIMLTLNNNVLVSSYDLSAIPMLQKQNDFYQYDWSRMRSYDWFWKTHNGTFCAGQDQGLSSCSFPAQHNTAPINLNLSPSLIKKAMANSGYGTHTLKFITTGDNDIDSDCQHLPLNMSVSVKYVVD